MTGSHTESDGSGRAAAAASTTAEGSSIPIDMGSWIASIFLPHGHHTAVIHKVDGGQIVLEGATFLGDQFNKDGDYLGDSYVETVDLTSNDVGYKIAWGKIAAIVLKGKGAKQPLSLVLRDGQIVDGFPDCSVGGISIIEGATTYMGHYKLRTILNLCSWSTRGFQKVELSD